VYLVPHRENVTSGWQIFAFIIDLSLEVAGKKKSTKPLVNAKVSQKKVVYNFSLLFWVVNAIPKQGHFQRESVLYL